MLPEIKVYKIDYDFIISNYLDKSLWKKKWNLFVYKDHVFTLNLYKIETETDRIVFKISYNKLNWDHEYVTYDIQNTSILILKKQINGAIFRLMETKDGYDARNSAGYCAIIDAKGEERERLRDIAEQYLDSNGIELEDVREAYIDRFVSRNTKTDSMAHNYLQGCMYTFLAEIMLVFTKITEDNARYNVVANAVGNKGNLALIESAVEQFVKELVTDEYEEAMTDALEKK
jgi:hypothetical protein